MAKSGVAPTFAVIDVECEVLPVLPVTVMVKMVPEAMLPGTFTVKVEVPDEGGIVIVEGLNDTVGPDCETDPDSDTTPVKPAIAWIVIVVEPEVPAVVVR